ncbi:MAG: DinB family protein, partial [Candidatus Limnocylindria bacterium]
MVTEEAEITLKGESVTGAPYFSSLLDRSSRGILRLLTLGCEQGGTIPTASTYIWRNLPLDVGHVLGYFVAHEAHHRGQIVLVARALGDR